VIPDELPGVTCRNVDIEIPQDRAAGPGALLAGLGALLLSELDSASTETLVAYRNGERWTEVFQPLRLPAPAGIPRRLRQGGVYMITGGLGGIGLAIAGYLARSVHARLVLVGRSAFPEPQAWDQWLARHAGEGDATSRRIRELRRLEADGAQVMVLSADVADEAQLRAAVARARARVGRSHGGGHGAGLGAGGIIALKSRADAAAVLAPKVEGTRVLERELLRHDLDFVVLCSSLTSVLGGPSRLEYCAANAFLDVFPAYCRQGQAPAVVAIDWDTWKDVGMAAAVTLPGTLAAHHEQALRLGIQVDEGVEAFRRILAAEPSLPRVLVSTRELGARLSKAAAAAAATPELGQAQPAAQDAQGSTRPAHMSKPYVPPRHTTDSKLAAIWQELIGIDAIGIEDDFFELGGHSLLAIQLVGRSNAAFGVKLTLQDLYAAPSVAALADRIESLCARGEPAYAGLADLVENLERYSEEDIRRIVAESRASGAGA
jgi:NADP-dependent 3-hydroxy acid dehydrogenase YdfG/acyl carrier protein